MSLETVVAADLSFTVSLAGGETVEGRLSGSESALDLEVSDPGLLAGRSDTGMVRQLAAVLAAHDVTVRLVLPSGPAVTLGARRCPWWQRRVTGSRHIRVERVGGLWALARGRARATAGALPAAGLAPPPTLWPPLPTLLRRPRAVTTTHDPNRGGNPRLVMAPRPDPWPGDTQEVFALRGEVITIGSGVECDIRLPGLEELHARVVHDEQDEFVLERMSRVGDTRVNGGPVETALLRTASRVQLGSWTMSFFREEYADHGRPFGGRVGGELGRQRPQPPRPSRSSWSTSAAGRPEESP